MPRLSQWYIKLSFGYLLAGFTVGALLLANKGRPLHPALWSLLPAHIEWLLLGWVAQFTLGVAFWILPRFWKAPRRGRTTGATAAIVLLNAGIVVVSLTALLGWPSWATAIGRGLEIAAAAAFAHSAWPRIVGREG